jgi:two-component system nitrogen regulation sensor histidine kinase NtrY
MGFRRFVLAGLGFALAFGFGAGFWAAAERGMWASAIAAGLLAFVAAAPTFARLRAQPGASRAAPVPGGDPMQDRRMAHLLDQAPAPLLMETPHGGVVAVNRAARTLFATDGRLAPPPAALREALAGLRAGERRVVRLGGEAPRAYALTSAEAMGPDGMTRLLSLTDIEAELAARETATLRQTLDVLSHEIMNSLTPVTSLAQTSAGLLADGDTDGAARALMTLERRASGLLRFVDSYRQLARLPEPGIRPAPLSILVEDAARLFAERWDGQDVALETAPAPDVSAPMDPDLMGQALLNLLSNAAEAALAARTPERPARVQLTARRRGPDSIAITVADNGSGLGDLTPEAIVKPFFTTKPGGAGIGLSLVSQIVQGHGGELLIEPHGLDGRGVSVTITLALN